MSRRAWLLLLVLVVYAGAAYAGPVDAVTNWFKEQFEALWADFVEFGRDMLVFAVESVLDLIATMVEAIPSPDFLQNASICGVLASAGPWATWAIGTFRLAEGFALIGGAVVFRLLRVFLTAFQWT
ncbi:MAG TPA: hypothetical protein VNR18_00790 [Hyphomicrobiales bacterium]|nr:hypothetical protein [Hyphomicrobiales bacterium]